MKSGLKRNLDSLNALLNIVNRDIETLISIIESQHPKYAALKYQSHETETTSIQSTLDATSALIEYVIGDDVLYIFYLDQQDFKWIEHKLSTKELEAKYSTLSLCFEQL